jgi:hypothetical protein
VQDDAGGRTSWRGPAAGRGWVGGSDVGGVGQG